MSTAKPMHTYRRLSNYLVQNGGAVLTPRQARQINRMAKREGVRNAAQTSSAVVPRNG